MREQTIARHRRVDENMRRVPAQKKLRCTPCYGRLALASRVRRGLYKLSCGDSVSKGYEKPQRRVLCDTQSRF
jgi:hypothetical protein